MTIVIVVTRLTIVNGNNNCYTHDYWDPVKIKALYAESKSSGSSWVVLVLYRLL